VAHPSLPPTTSRRADVLGALGTILTWAAVVACTGMGGDFPLNDDWAYAWSARHLAETGQVRILDWAAPSLVSHVAWGGLLVRLFGPSFVVLRAGGALIGGIGLLLLYRLGRLAGLPPARSVLLALLVGLSPWYLALSLSYMTDVPWTVLVLGAAVAALSADRGRPAWLLAAGLLLSAAVLCRQVALVVLPAWILLVAADARADGAGWRMRATFRALLVAAPVAIAFGVFQVWYLRVHGPTAAYRATFDRVHELTVRHVAGHVLAVLAYAGLWCLPVVVACFSHGRRSRQLLAGRGRLLVAALLAGLAVNAALNALPDVGPAMPYLGNVLQPGGIGPRTLDEAPRSDLAWLWVAVTVVSLLAAVVWTGWLGRALRDTARQLRSRAAPDPRERVRLLLVSLSAIYLLYLLATSSLLFDRYLLPLMPLAAWLAVDALPRERGLGAAGWGALVVLAAYSVQAERSYLGWHGALDGAVRALEARGVDPGQIDAGFEENATRHFIPFFARTGRLVPDDDSFWVSGARYRIAFVPLPACRVLERVPYFSVGRDALYVHDCKGVP
jgi:4-amino-4-deoxy-L-arabinose transferase-like glycosyltransferase